MPRRLPSLQFSEGALPFTVTALTSSRDLSNPSKNAPQPAACGTWQPSNSNKEEMITSRQWREQRCIVASEEALVPRGLEDQSLDQGSALTPSATR